MTWKLVFSTATNRGVGFNRDAGEGEFAIDKPASECAWFSSDPGRYQYVDGVFSEVSTWEEEQAALKLEADRNDMDVKIVAEEDKRSYLPFPHTDGHTYKVSAAIQNTRMRLEGADQASPIDWDDVNGVTVHMTVGEFVAMANAVYDRGAANYSVAKYHKAEMRKLDKPQEYDFSTGWY